MKLLVRIARLGFLLYAAAIAASGEAFGGGTAPDSTVKSCPPGAKSMSRTAIVQIAKKELEAREPGNTYGEISAEKTEDKCAWLVVATRRPAQPGAARYIMIANDGRIIEYRGGQST